MNNFSKQVAHIVCPYLSINGSWIYNQIIYLKKYHPIVFTNEVCNLEIFPYNDIYSISELHPLRVKYEKAISNFFLIGYPYHKSKMKEKRVHLIHAHFGPTGFKQLNIKKSLKIPLITAFYGADASRVHIIDHKWKNRYKKLFNEGELFLAEGNFMKKTLVELGCSEEKVKVQHLGVDLGKINFIPREIGDDGKIRILVAGTFTEKKGIPLAVKAFGKLKQKYDNLELILVGDARQKGSDHKIKQEILSIIKEMGMDESVKMTGYIPYKNLLEEAEKCHIFVSPSIHAKDGDTEGGCPVTIIDMSASGMPVLSTWHCDIPEVIIDGKSGLLVEEKNEDELLEKLEFLIKNPDMWIKMGEFGRKHIEKKYNIAIQIERLESIYDELL